MSELTFQKLVDAIKKTDYKYFGDYEMTEEQRDAVGILVDATVELMSVSASLKDGMISVADAVPSKSGEYKVRYEGHYSDDSSRFNASIFPWLRYWSDEKYCGRKVTHWMPFPRPPAK